MNIIYSGGFDKYSTQSEQSSVLYAYKEKIDILTSRGEKVAFVTMAKPDGYYEERLFKTYGKVLDSINHATSQVTWQDYSMIILLGGETLDLKDGLERVGFSIDRLKKDVILIGDSAGAYLLSAWFFESKLINGTRSTDITFHEGYLPQSNFITVAHIDNPRYTVDELLRKVHAFAKQNNLDVLLLKENERVEKVF